MSLDPVTLAIAAAAISATGQVAGGLRARGEGEYQADIANNNARLALQRSEAEQAEIARRQRQRTAMQRASAAARGVEFSGTALDIAAQDIQAAELEKRYVAHRGLVQKRSLQSQGDAARTGGQVAFGSSILSAGGTLLSGASAAARAGGGDGDGATGTAGG